MNKEIDITNISLRTKRLILRPWKESDLSDLYEYAKIDGVGQMAVWLPHKDLNESKTILDMFIREKKVFAIEYKSKVIGSLGIEQYNTEFFDELDPLFGREIGFVLSKDYWGQEIMPEAVNEVIRFLFEDVKLDFLICSHYIENSQSKRVQEKVGFKKNKTIKHKTRSGIEKDTVYSILKKEEWLKTL